MLGTGDVKTVDDSNLALSQIDAALQQIATTGAQLGAYQNRFTAAITGLNTDSTNLTQRTQRDPGHGLRAGHLGAVEGPDPAAGQHGDGGPGQHGSAERSDAAAEAAVRIDSK